MHKNHPYSSIEDYCSENISFVLENIDLDLRKKYIYFLKQHIVLTEFGKKETSQPFVVCKFLSMFYSGSVSVRRLSLW